jgi:hypothetical protein
MAVDDRKGEKEDNAKVPRKRRTTGNNPEDNAQRQRLRQYRVDKMNGRAITTTAR